MSNESTDWVRGGTPRDDDGDWSEDQSEYGTTVEPEWDDYASEQSLPVAAPQPQASVPPATQPAGSSGAEPSAPVSSSEDVNTDSYDPAQDRQQRDAILSPVARPEHQAQTAELPDDDRPTDPAPGAEQPTGQAARQRVAEPVEPGRAAETDQPVPEPATNPIAASLADQPVDDSVAPDQNAARAVEETAVRAPLRSESRQEPMADDDIPAAPAPGAGDPVQHVAAGDPQETLTPGRTSPAVRVTENAPVEQQETVVPAGPTPEPEPVAASQPEAAGPRPEATETVVTDTADEPPVVEEQPVAAPDVTEPDHEPTAPVWRDEPAVSDGDAAFRAPGAGTEPELEATQAVPTVQPSPTAEMAGLYRTGEVTTETPAVAVDEREVEERELAEQLAAEREARERRLGVVSTSTANEVREPVEVPRRTTDKWFASFGLFVLRLVTAALLGVTAYQILGGGIDRTADYLAQQPLIPEPRTVAWVLGFGLGVMAILLVIGALTRLTGLLLLALSVATLVLLRWGQFSIFVSGTEGFIGDKDLLLAAVGLLLLTLGSGGWGLDAAVRKSRARAKAERAS